MDEQENETKEELDANLIEMMVSKVTDNLRKNSIINTLKTEFSEKVRF